MILESGGGELVGDVVDVVSKPMDQAPVVLHVAEVRRILGGDLDAGQIFRLLKRLGFTLIPEGQDDAQFRVHIPSWRLDVEREIDVIEEIARLHGYDKFENTLPAYSGAVVELPHAAMDATFRRAGAGFGIQRSIVADIYFACGCGEVFVGRGGLFHGRASAGTGESAERRGAR